MPVFPFFKLYRDIFVQNFEKSFVEATKTVLWCRVLCFTLLLCCSLNLMIVAISFFKESYHSNYFSNELKNKSWTSIAEWHSACGFFLFFLSISVCRQPIFSSPFIPLSSFYFGTITRLTLLVALAALIALITFSTSSKSLKREYHTILF